MHLTVQSSRPNPPHSRPVKETSPQASTATHMGLTHHHTSRLTEKTAEPPLHSAPAGSIDLHKATDLHTAIKHAEKETQKRIEEIKKFSPSDQPTGLLPSNKVERINRLNHRLEDLKSIPIFLEKNNLTFKGFSGWDKKNAVITPTRSNISQFESIVAHTKEGETTHIPLESRYLQSKGAEVDLLSYEVRHDNHSHTVWNTFALQKVIDKSVKWTIGENEEGCPCCVAGLDLDELAAAIKEIFRTSEGADKILSLPDFGSAEHWGVLLGVAAPLGLIGLAAAIRNIKGTIKTRAHLKQIIQGVEADIQRLKAENSLDDVKTLSAFKKTLQYSKFDTDFNLVVPGVVNGIASSMVLTTILAKHPFTLPIIALYATGQLARNTYDLSRVWNHKVNLDEGDSMSTLGGKRKINAIASEKRKFYIANAAGFAAFAAGATLTFLSVPALGLFGAGTVILPIGLTLLTLGAVSTGWMNNKYPKKFQPRNGDLGISRFKVQDKNHLITEIHDRRKKKKIIQAASPVFKGNKKLQKKWLKFLTAMPEVKDFFPKSLSSRWVNFKNSKLPFLPPTGTQASSRKHSLNIETIKHLHSNEDKSKLLQKTRIGVLEELAGKTEPTSDVVHDEKDLLKQSWDLLKECGLEKNVLKTWLHEGFANNGHDHGCCDDSHSDHKEHHHKEHSSHGHHHEEHGSHGHHHEEHGSHGHHHEEHGSHGHHHKEHSSHRHHHEKHGSHGHHHEEHSDHSSTIQGIEEKSGGWFSFNFDKFIESSDAKSRKDFNSAIDYFIFYQHEKTLRYQQYGLNDFYWQMNKQ